MVFIDSNGQPFFVAQYPDGEPDVFMTRIEQAVAQKGQRDEHFTLAKVC